MVPLLGLMALAGGALGQQWYWDKREEGERARARGILGDAPEVLGGDVAGPPRPGTGLMGILAADPGNEQNQLAFKRGLMDLPKRERAAANTMFESIMGRASQASLTREGWGRQEAASAVHEENTNRRWAQEQVGIESRFQQGHQLNLEQFQENKRTRGEDYALRLFEAQQRNLLQWREDARQQSAEARARASAAGGPKLELPKLPVGWEHVAIPDERGQPKVIARPVERTPEWQRAKEQVDEVAALRSNIAMYRQTIEESGTELYGPKSRAQVQLYNRIVAQVGKIDKLGTLQLGDLQRLASEFPDPSSFGALFSGNKGLLAQLDGLDQQAQREQGFQRERYSGWANLRIAPPVEVKVEEGRSAPPPGSTPIGSGRPSRYGGRGGSY